MTQLKLGFIGGGLNSAVGAAHFTAVSMDSRFRVEAGCFSRHEEINNRTAEQWNVAAQRVYPSWQSMLAGEVGRLDAVVVLTPTPEHKAPVIAALTHGFPVICEKALASTSDEAREIDSVVRDVTGYLSVTYNYTGYPMVRELKEMIRQGKLGRIEQIHIEMPQEGFARLNREGKPMVPQQWRLKDGVIPTISLDLGVHVLHMIDFLTGEKAIEVVATQSRQGRFTQVVDNTMAIIRYTNDVECGVWFSKAALGHRNGLRVRVYGAEGSVEWFQMDPEVLIYSDNRGCRHHIDRGHNDLLLAHESRYNRFKSGHPSGFLEAFANLYADIGDDLMHRKSGSERGCGYTFTAQEAMEGLRILEAMTISAHERRWVEIGG